MQTRNKLIIRTTESETNLSVSCALFKWWKSVKVARTCGKLLRLKLTCKLINAIKYVRKVLRGYKTVD